MLAGAARRRKKALRLWAWRLTPKTAVYPLKFVETYSCKDCQRGTGWDLARRKGQGCTRDDLPRVRWALDRRMLTDPSTGGGLYLGRYPDPALEGTEDMIPVSPTEPHERTSDGCPAGWLRTRYVNSLAPYTRTRTDHGGRVDNPRFTAAGEHVQAAVMCFEREQERHIAWRADIVHRRAETERARKKGRNGPRR